MSVAIFCLFRCFAEKEYQTESKRNETFGRVIFGTNVIQGTWSGHQEINEEATRQGGTPRGVGAPPPRWAPRSSTDVLLLPIYTHIPQNHQGIHRRNISATITFCIREIPSWSLRRCSAGGRTDHGGPLPPRPLR